MPQLTYTALLQPSQRVYAQAVHVIAVDIRLATRADLTFTKQLYRRLDYACQEEYE